MSLQLGIKIRSKIFDLIMFNRYSDQEVVSNVSDNVIYNNNMISASNIISHNDTNSDASNHFSMLTPSVIHHAAYTNTNMLKNDYNINSNCHKDYVKNMTSELF